MPPVAGAVSIVAEYTRTSGTGAYTVEGRVARAARFAEFYSTGDTFDYYTDDGGGLAEYAVGQLNADGTISRQSIHWSTLGGVGTGPIAWAATGRRIIRAVVSAVGGGGGPTTPWMISGFWNGTVATGDKLERYLFAKPGTLVAGLPDSLIRADTPVGGGVAPPTVNFIVTEAGDHIVDETGDDVVDATGGVPVLLTVTPAVFIVTEAGDQIVDETGDPVVESFAAGADVVLEIRMNGVQVGSATFAPGVVNGVRSLPVSVSANIGDLFELVGGPIADPDLSDIVWTFVVS